MPKPFNLLQKCSEMRSDGSPCRAVAVKNTLYCRHHLPNHPEELAKVTEEGSYAFLKNDEEDACQADLNSTDDITVLKASIGILRGRIAQLIKEPTEGKALNPLLKTIEQLRKTVETLAKSDAYWEHIGRLKVNEALKYLGEMLRKHMDEEELQKFRKELDEKRLGRSQERQGDGTQ